MNGETDEVLCPGLSRLHGCFKVTWDLNPCFFGSLANVFLSANCSYGWSLHS